MSSSDRRRFRSIHTERGTARIPQLARLYRGERFTTLAKAPLDLYPDATARLYRAFFAAIEEGREPPNSIAEARHTLDLIYRAYGEAERP